MRRSQDERERLLRHAIDASELERRRIAADLHDGSVQQLAGLSMTLAAKADELAVSDPAASEVLGDAAARTRQGMRSLRSAVMGISPPICAGQGSPRLWQISRRPSRLRAWSVEVHVPDGMDLPPDVEALLFRASREGIRNVVSHARAHHVLVTVTPSGHRVVLEVRDDGVGLDDDRRAAQQNGHVGLRLLGELVTDAGGLLDVTSASGDGTVLRVEVPVP